MILIHKDPIEFLVSAALLHLSYNCAPLLLTSVLVTHDPFRKSGPIDSPTGHPYNRPDTFL
jgi:hypothetical protein